MNIDSIVNYHYDLLLHYYRKRFSIVFPDKVIVCGVYPDEFNEILATPLARFDYLYPLTSTSFIIYSFDKERYVIYVLSEETAFSRRVSETRKADYRGESF